jgi:TolB-like protein
MKCTFVRMFGLLLLVMACCPEMARSEDKPATGVAAAKATAPKITVAVLDFAASLPGHPELGAEVAETLTATLSGETGFTLVDRSSLARTLQEHELSLTGLVSAEQATKVGKLAGAKILVTGKVFVLDKQIFITAKLMGTETSLVDGILVKGEKDADLGALLIQLSEKLAKRLPDAAPKLVAAEELAIDPVPGLKKKLAGLKLPKLSVNVAERHVQVERAARIDPAVETEVKMLLVQCGFTVIDGDAKDRAKAGVEVEISGEAFTEFGARIGNLISCTGRVEIKVNRVSNGKVLLADRDNGRSVDISENLAAKTALQKSGRTLAIHILEYFSENLPAADKERKQP